MGSLPIKKHLLGTDTNNINVIGIMYQKHLNGFLKYFIMRKEGSTQSQKLKSSILLIPVINKIGNYLIVHRLSILISKPKLTVIYFKLELVSLLKL